MERLDADSEVRGGYLNKVVIELRYKVLGE